MKKLCLNLGLIILCLLVNIQIVNADEISNTYGAKITKNSITTTKKALKKYKQKKSYTIKPSSKPLKSSGFTKYSSYNKYTKNYYTIRSYLEKFEKAGGGTLILKKGTYKIPCTLFIPSNTTIILENGVNIIKTTEVGSSKLIPSNSIFQLVSPKKANGKGIIKKYNGVKNINIIGINSAVIDLDYSNKTNGIILGHNKNVKIIGITFKNMNNAHFIEVDATKNAVIDHCIFLNAKLDSDYVKEAINIDTPDAATKGFNCDWSSKDKTPNNTIKITNCTFSCLGRAIGTHKYSAKGSTQMMHSNITIKNNVISNMYNDGAIRVMNWKDCIISNNTITSINNLSNPSKQSTSRAILLSGTNNVKIVKNYIANCGRAFQYIAWKNTGGGSSYPIIKDKLSSQNKSDLQNNWVVNLLSGEYFTRLTYVYNVYTNAEKISFSVGPYAE